MLFTALIFYFLFAILTCAFFLILVKNPIHSIFFLILVFANTTGVFLLLNIEFLAMLLLIVYMGAISVLFLFVIMMLNIRLLELRDSFWKYSFVSFYLIIVFVSQLLLFFIYGGYSCDLLLVETNYYTLAPLLQENLYYINWADNFLGVRDVKTLGYLLYTYYSFTFIIIGIVLLLAMVSAITLALKPTLYSKKQSLYKQISRQLLDSIYQIK